MPHPIATLAISLAPYAADLVNKIVGYKKEAQTNKSLEQRLDRLEDYEVEQAKLVKELTDKVEQMQRRITQLNTFIIIAFLFAIASLFISAFLISY